MLSLVVAPGCLLPPALFLCCCDCQQWLNQLLSSGVNHFFIPRHVQLFPLINEINEILKLPFVLTWVICLIVKFVCRFKTSNKKNLPSDFFVSCVFFFQGGKIVQHTLLMTLKNRKCVHKFELILDFL